MYQILIMFKYIIFCHTKPNGARNGAKLALFHKYMPDSTGE